MEPTKKPRYQLKRVYDDGTESEPEIVSVTRLPWNTKMKRRAVLGVGFGSGAALALILGKEGGDGQRAVAAEPSGGSTRAHKNAVWKIVIALDNKTLISGSADGTIKFWELPNGRWFKTLEAHPKGVLSLAISPDGQTLASGGADGLLKLWNLPEAILSQTLKAHNQVKSLIFSSDSRTLFSGGTDGSIKFWDLTTGRLINTWKAFSKAVYDLAISEPLLAAASGDGTVKTFHLQTEVIETWQVSERPEPVYTLLIKSIDVHNKILVAGSGDGRLRSVKLVNYLLQETSRKMRVASEKSINTLGINPQNQNLISGDNEGKLKEWTLEGLRLIGSLQISSSPIYTLDVSSDGNILGSGSSDGTIKLVDPSVKTEKTTLRDPGELPGTSSIKYWVLDENGRQVVYTIPCGLPIPTGAGCTCNCVTVPKPEPSCRCVSYSPPSCSCVSYSPPSCSCVSYSPPSCSCVPVCTCVPVSY